MSLHIEVDMGGVNALLQTILLSGHF